MWYFEKNLYIIHDLNRKCNSDPVSLESIYGLTRLNHCLPLISYLHLVDADTTVWNKVFNCVPVDHMIRIQIFKVVQDAKVAFGGVDGKIEQVDVRVGIWRAACLVEFKVDFGALKADGQRKRLLSASRVERLNALFEASHEAQYFVGLQDGFSSFKHFRSALNAKKTWLFFVLLGR